MKFEFPDINLQKSSSEPLCYKCPGRFRGFLPKRRVGFHTCAARAGKNTPFFYGNEDADFSAYANLSDASMKNFATNPYAVGSQYALLLEYDDWIPADKRFSDGALLTVEPGSYQPNDWGIYDVHGNVAEWTRDLDATGKSLVKGGSWYDRPRRAAIHTSRTYPEWQRVFDVGFRVVLEDF